MRILSRLFALTAALVATVGVAGAQTPKEEVFGLLNLDMPELAAVKAHYEEGRVEEAAEALLAYYKGRTHITTPDIPNPAAVRISANEQKWADEALEHTFFVHYGYQPSFNYGEDIDWRYWPVRDNELRWQLHRHKWFTPMGKAYRVSGQERYAEEWTKQYLDWIRKNPLVKLLKLRHLAFYSAKQKHQMTLLNLPCFSPNQIYSFEL